MRKFCLWATVVLSSPSLAVAKSDHQTWNAVTLKSSFRAFDYGVELENRTSESDSAENLHQIKPEIFYKLSKGKIGFIYTFETDGSFKEKFENRYSFAYDFDSYKNKSIKITTRLRQEFRNFADQDELAYRFRFRNNLEYQGKIFWNLVPSISSEWRIYQKDSAGKSFENFSHRAILSLEREFDSYLISLNYVHNFQKEDGPDQNTHALGLGLTIKM